MVTVQCGRKMTFVVNEVFFVETLRTVVSPYKPVFGHKRGARKNGRAAAAVDKRAPYGLYVSFDLHLRCICPTGRPSLISFKPSGDSPSSQAYGRESRCDVGRSWHKLIQR